MGMGLGLIEAGQAPPHGPTGVMSRGRIYEDAHDMGPPGPNHGGVRMA